MSGEPVAMHTPGDDVGPALCETLELEIEDEDPSSSLEMLAPCVVHSKAPPLHVVVLASTSATVHRRLLVSNALGRGPPRA